MPAPRRDLLANPESSRLYGNNGSRSKFSTMNVQCPLAHACMLSCRESDYAQYSAMRSLVDNGQLAEVLVQCYEDTLLTMGDGKNLIVSRITLPISGHKMS